MSSSMDTSLSPESSLWSGESAGGSAQAPGSLPRPSLTPMGMARSAAGAGQPDPTALKSALGHWAEPVGKGPRRLDGAVASAMGRAFGHDFSDVSIHTDSTQATGGTHAFASGTDIHFATGAYAPDTDQGKWLLAHELAHVVQQRGSPPGMVQAYAPDEALGQLEGDADQAAHRVVAGLPAQVGLRAAAGSVQRFNEDEHARIGDNGAKDSEGKVATVELAQGYSVSNGDMVAMAGDYFASIDQMRALAAQSGTGAGTREEIEYVRQCKVHKGPEGSFSESAKAAVDKRYYKLAANNAVHFPNARTGDADSSVADRAGTAPDPLQEGWLRRILFPKAPHNAIEGYRYNHVRALVEAVQAGAAKQSVDSAMACEAFGAHFLTDSFSAGHVRTERQSIKEYWDKKIPMFFYNLKGWMAEEIAKRMSRHYSLGPVQVREDVIFDPPFADGSKQLIAEKLDRIGPLGFGDLVSGALHDYDNDHGLKATAEGQDVKLYGDGKAGKGDEERLATHAVALGRSEVAQAFALGAQGMSPNDVVHKLLGGDRLYSAERLIPKAKPDAEQGAEQKKGKWDFPDVDALLNDGQFARGAKLFADDKAKEITKQAADFSAAKRQAVRDGVVDPLRAQPVPTVRTIIHWTPTLTDSAAGHNTDDHSNDYWKEAKRTPGGLHSLTYVQRERLISHLLDGWVVGDDEDAIMDILQSAPKGDAKSLINHFGWDRLYDKIDDGPGEAFKNAFPKAEYGS